jgi:hypothetical protein
MKTSIRVTHLCLGAAALTATLGLAMAACANGSAPANAGQGQPTMDSGDQLDSTSNVDSFMGFTGDTGNVFGGGDGGPINVAPCNGTLTVTPPSATVTVTVGPSGVMTSPVTFTAQCNGATIPVVWNIDRGDLGSIGATSGVFTASGQGAGMGTVTATAGNVSGTATVTVQLHTTQNGAVSATDGGAPEAGVGGNGGVGGEPLGGPVPMATVTLLQGAANPNAGPTAGVLAWLYPYDQTVWPQGILPPLLQWTPTPTKINAVYVHLKQANYEFEGFFSIDNTQDGGANLINTQPIDPTAWTIATNGNGGDPLHVEITVSDGTHVYGPIAENWHVAPGQLKGVVYYSSYYTQLAAPVYENQPAAILSIRSGSTSPTLAIPGSANKCLVCHEISGDGATMYASNGQAWPNYNETDVFDLRSGSSTPTQTFGAPGNATSTDGTFNDRKFLWSGLWQDGSFVLQGSGTLVDETYAWQEQATPGATDSRIFRRTDGNSVPAAGFDGQIQDAVTPAFSPDGTMMVFNFFTAQTTADAGLPGGNGHTLDLMDFACGMPLDAGSPPSPTAGPACGSAQFSGLRRIYTNADVANGWPGWPAWLPDSNGIVFQNTVVAGGRGHLSTWAGAKAEVWFVTANTAAKPTAPPALAMNALNGKNPDGTSYLPTNTLHPNDTIMNYEPTVSPIASGGYFWVVFTSRRMYGNVAAGDPYAVGNGTYPVNKKLWVAAVDLHPTPGKDPSHPAFYLPAQELNAPNMRGYWVPAPCEADGKSCSTGDECCGGFCQQGTGGALVCTSQKPVCAGQYDKCASTSDCCGAGQGYTCINHTCSRPVN